MTAFRPRVVVSPLEPLRGRVQKVQKVQRVQRVVDCPAGNAYKVSVTGLPFCHISRSKHGGESATSGGFSPFGAYGTTFPPQKRGHNKAPYSIPLISGSKVSTGCCPTACGGEGGGASHQRGPLFPRPSGRLYGLIIRGAPLFSKAPTTPSEPCEPFAPSEPSRPKGVSIRAPASPDPGPDF